MDIHLICSMSGMRSEIQNRGGSDYIYLTRTLDPNEEHRRCETHYFIKADRSTDYSVPYLLCCIRAGGGMGWAL